MAAGDVPEIPPETEILRALERLEERPDADYPAEVRAVFAEVRETLRTPFEGLLFRLLAKDPPLLASVWSAVKGSLASRYAEREADRLREHALFIVPDPEIGATHRSHLARHGIDADELATIARFQETVHYGLPKLLLVAAGVSRALHGERVGGGRRLPEDDLRRLEPGVPADAVHREPLATERLEAAPRATLEALRAAHGHPIVASYFNYLAHWPVYLERVHQDLRLIVGSGRYRAASATLATLAEVGAKGFPYELKVEVTGALPQPVVAAFLSFLHERLFPDLLLDVAYLRALLEREHRARGNRFSLTSAQG